MTELSELPMAPTADLADHMRLRHGRGPLELMADHDHLADLHRFEHVEAELGLTTVRHRH